MLLAVSGSSMVHSLNLPGRLSDWSSLLGREALPVLEELGPGWVPVASDTDAEFKIYYYDGGLSLWSDGGRLVQLRLDSDWSGSCMGVRIGQSPDSLRRSAGEPWLEKDGSLYYNLPWNGGPVRLRFVFGADGLREIYLYKVG